MAASAWKPVQEDTSAWKPVQEPTKVPAAPEPGILDKEIIPDSYGAATLQGLQSIGRGIRSAGEGMLNLVKPVQPGENPIAVAAGSRLIKPFVDTAKQIPQIPAAIHDLNQSADPVSAYGRVAQETAGQGAGQAVGALATEGLSRAVPAIAESVIPGRALKTTGKVIANQSIYQPLKAISKVPEYWDATSPEGEMLSATKKAVSEGRAARIPTRVPVTPEVPTPGSPGIQPSGTSLIPEPRAPFAGENEGYMASVPRGTLSDLATSGKPGAGTQLQQLGQPIIYIPREADWPIPVKPKVR